MDTHITTQHELFQEQIWCSENAFKAALSYTARNAQNTQAPCGLQKNRGFQQWAIRRNRKATANSGQCEINCEKSDQTLSM